MEEHKNEEKTFTQAELNAIVQKRLGEEKAKYENYEELKAKALKFDELEEQNKSELQKANDKAEALQKESEGKWYQAQGFWNRLIGEFGERVSKS